MHQLISSASIELKHVITRSISVTPPWKYNIPFFLFDINIDNDKSSTSPEFVLTKFHESKSNYPQHIDICIVGSKIGDEAAGDEVAAANIIPNK